MTSATNKYWMPVRFVDFYSDSRSIWYTNTYWIQLSYPTICNILKFEHN